MTTASSTFDTDQQPQTIRTRQREALKQLMQLTQACQSEDQNNKQTYQDRQAHLDKRLAHGLDRSQQAQVQADQAEEIWEQKSRQFRIDQGVEQQALDRRVESMHASLEQKTEDAKSKLKEDIQQAVWVADSVLEGVESHVSSRTKQESRQADLWATELSEKRQAIEKYLTRYPKKMRPWESQAAVDGNGQTQRVWPQWMPTYSPTAALTQDDADLAYQQYLEAFDEACQVTRSFSLPGFFADWRPYLVFILLMTVGTFVGPAFREKLVLNQDISDFELAAISAGSSFFLIVLFGWAAWAVAKHQLSNATRQAATVYERTQACLTHYRKLCAHLAEQELSQARDEHTKAMDKLKERFGPIKKEFHDRRHKAASQLKKSQSHWALQLRQQQAEALEVFEKQKQQAITQAHQRPGRRQQITQARFDRDVTKLKQWFEQANDALKTKWHEGRQAVLTAFEEGKQLEATSNQAWGHEDWENWQPPLKPAPAARFGQLEADAHMLVDGDAHEADAVCLEAAAGMDSNSFELQLPDDFRVPALLAGPNQRSLLIQTDPEGRDISLQTLKSVMLRLLTTLPAGQCKFTLIDPVGLGETFAGFMHLADYDETLVNGRIWSEPAQIDQRLLDLTDHLSTVIQKHLRNEFDNIDAYNEQAGELAEPYRFVVVADYPHGLSSTAIARLNAIAQSGPRCGVFVLAAQDTRQKLPPDVDDDLAARCTTIRQLNLQKNHLLEQTQDQSAQPIGKRFTWQDEVFGKLNLSLDTAPPDQLVSRLVNVIGEASIDASRVQVPFATITPEDQDIWSRCSAEELAVPIGRSGATRLQQLVFGRGVAQHALIAGKTGSGKSSLLHALVTNLALWYSPDELELYLVDFKKGVEFKPYVTHRLPHARAIAIESDRAFGLSILKKLDRELDERGELFRQAGVQNLASYRQHAPEQPMPRVLLVVDEFQELFAQDDEIAQNAATLLDRLVRQGRAFGVHALMGSQSLSGAAGLAMGTMSQMAIRIALMCGEADSQLILGDDNTAARLLNRPGEAIYNDQSGQVTANSLFQVAWLPEQEHKNQLQRVEQQYEQTRLADAAKQAKPAKSCAVFEGSAPAEIAVNPELTHWLEQGWLTGGQGHDERIAPRALIGEPVAIENATAFELPRFAGANGLIVGQNADAALALCASSMLSLAAQLPPDRCRFVVLNGSPEVEHDDRLAELAQALPHDVQRVSWRQTTDSVGQLHDLMQTRSEAASENEQAVYIFVFGLHRLRELRKSEDDFSFSLDDDVSSSASIKPDKQFAELLNDGPAVGIHTVAWCDRAAAIEQSLDRRDMRAFDQRVLFQMSANDSAQLIDTTQANELGPYRALIYRDDRGTMQVFRPYGLPERSWLSHVFEKAGMIE